MAPHFGSVSFRSIFAGVLAVTFFLMAGSARADQRPSCQCIAASFDKKYVGPAQSRFLGMGTKRTWTCQYRCVDDSGNEEEVTGTQTGSFFVEEGYELSCYGTVYKAHETPNNPKRMMTYMPESRKWFDPKKSEIGELENWAKESCGPGKRAARKTHSAAAPSCGADAGCKDPTVTETSVKPNNSLMFPTYGKGTPQKAVPIGDAKPAQ